MWAVVPATRMKRSLAVAVTLATAGATTAMAADGTWTGAGGDNQWSNVANWTAVPGVADGTFTSPDVATFGPSSPGATIAVDVNRNVAGLTFDSSTANFTIGDAGLNGGAALHLTNGGLTRVASTVAPAGLLTQSLAINAPVMLAGNGYTFAHNASSTLAGIIVRGNVTSSAAGATTLTLDGVHGTQTGSTAEIRGSINNGASGTIGIVKQGTGWWELIASSANPNTYSGDTIINAGTLRIAADVDGGNDGLGGLSPNSNYIINNGGGLRVSLADNTARSVTVNTGGLFSVSTAASQTVRLRNNDGFALTMNYAGLVGDAAVAMPLALTGTVAGQGGIRYVPSASAGIVSIGATGSTLELGTVMRPFDIGAGASLATPAPGAIAAYDVRTRGPIAGGGTSGGILKLGAGIFRIDGTTNSFTGTLEVREGEVRFSNSLSNTLTGLPKLLVSGGQVRINGGFAQTFSDATFTRGGTIGSNSTSTIHASNFSLNVAAPDTVRIGTALANAPGTTAALTKTGAGLAILVHPLSYTGATTVNGGTLQLNENAHTAVLGTTTPATTVADLRAGRLVFDYTGNVSRADVIVPILDAGHDADFSTGPIRSSTATANRGLGYLDDAANQKFIVAAALYGDSNLDGNVNFADLVRLAQNYNQTGKTWDQGDSNYDGGVNFADLVALARNYNQSIATGSMLAIGDAASFAGDWALAQSLVPEPASLMTIAVAAGVVARRRRS
jgi:autotransporter-associated beta strand protein